MPVAFKITVEGAGEATCYGGERVLVAMERAQSFGRLKNLPYKLPVGCRRGGCGICRARVLSGAYQKHPMSRAHITEEDEAAGLILSCSVYPLSDIELRIEPPQFASKTKMAVTSEET